MGENKNPEKMSSVAEVAAAAKLEQAKLRKEQAEANAKIKAAKDALAVKKAETEAKLKASLASIELDKKREQKVKNLYINIDTLVRNKADDERVKAQLAADIINLDKAVKDLTKAIADEKAKSKALTDNLNTFETKLPPYDTKTDTLNQQRIKQKEFIGALGTEINRIGVAVKDIEQRRIQTEQAADEQRVIVLKEEALRRLEEKSRKMAELSDLKKAAALEKRREMEEDRRRQIELEKRKQFDREQRRIDDNIMSSKITIGALAAGGLLLSLMRN